MRSLLHEMHALLEARSWKVYGQMGYPPREVEQEATSEADAIDVGNLMIKAGIEHVKAEPIYKGSSKKHTVIEFTPTGPVKTSQPRGGFPWTIGVRINKTKK